MEELKARANELYKQLNENIQKYKELSREYVEVLKEIENEANQPHF